MIHIKICLCIISFYDNTYVVKFCGNCNEMHWTHIKTVKRATSITRHIESCSIIREITIEKQRNKKAMKILTESSLQNDAYIEKQTIFLHDFQRTPYMEHMQLKVQFDACIDHQQ